MTLVTNPFALTQAHKADAFVQLCAIAPELRNNRDALIWALGSADVVDELFSDLRDNKEETS